MLESQDYGRILVFPVLHGPVNVSVPVCSNSSQTCFWLPSSTAMGVFGCRVLSSCWLELFVFSHVQHEGLTSEEAKIEWHIKIKWGFAGRVVAAQIDGGGATPQEAERNVAHQVESNQAEWGQVVEEGITCGKSKGQQSILEMVTMPLVHAVSPSSCCLLCEISLWNMCVCLCVCVCVCLSIDKWR